MVRIVSIFVATQVLVGCAIGQTIDFRRQTVGLAAYSAAEMPGTFRVGVLDKRGDTETHVGTNHGVIPFPWPVTTESGKPLAEDVAGAILAGFERTRLRTYGVRLSSATTVSDARVEVRPFRGDVGYLFTIREFWVRTWFSTSFSYDVLLEVLDADGAIAASAEAKDVEALGDYTPAQLSGQLFSRLLIAPQIRAAAKRLTERSDKGSRPAPPTEPQPSPATPVSAPEQPVTKPSPVAAPPPAQVPEQPTTKSLPTTPTKPPARATKCSVEQVLKMKAMALTDEQIRAACPE